MADFSVYGHIYNDTYYDFPKPTADDPEYGTWNLKPEAVKAGEDTPYTLNDNSGCHGAQAKFYSKTGICAGPRAYR